MANSENSNLEWLERVFKQTVGNEKEIRREEFKKIVISRNVRIILLLEAIDSREQCFILIFF